MTAYLSYALFLLVGVAVALGACTTGVRTEDSAPSPAGSYVTYAAGEYRSALQARGDGSFPGGGVQAGRDVTYTVYPPYGSDGHLMFLELSAYWTDVVDFLRKHL